jgi:hypothetical protein
MSDSNNDINRTPKTRGGDPVTIISTNGRHPYTIIGYVGDSTTPVIWTSTGQFRYGYPHDLRDLVEGIPEKRYLCLYHKAQDVASGLVFTRRNDAVRFSKLVAGDVEIREV